jgi:tRNA (cytidine/uridine-2'-O-)-methyltransferase
MSYTKGVSRKGGAFRHLWTHEKPGLPEPAPCILKASMGRKVNTFVSADERAPRDRKLTREGALTIVLVHPRIPQNTGSIARLCAATGCRLDLIRPLFPIDDAKLKRAGLDYWPLLDVRVFESLDDWFTTQAPTAFAGNTGAAPWLVEVGGTRLYTEAEFRPGDCVFFGDEQDGIPPSLLERLPERQLRLPQQGVRSLNLSMATGIVVYEALRQLGWRGDS